MFPGRVSRNLFGRICGSDIFAFLLIEMPVVGINPVKIWGKFSSVLSSSTGREHQASWLLKSLDLGWRWSCYGSLTTVVDKMGSGLEEHIYISEINGLLV